MAEEKRNLETIPAGSLGIITLAGCQTLGEQVDHYLVKWRQERESEHKNSLAFSAPVKERVSFWSPCAVWTFIFLWMWLTTV